MAFNLQDEEFEDPHLHGLIQDSRDRFLEHAEVVYILQAMVLAEEDFPLSVAAQLLPNQPGLFMFNLPSTHDRNAWRVLLNGRRGTRRTTISSGWPAVPQQNLVAVNCTTCERHFGVHLFFQREMYRLAGVQGIALAHYLVVDESVNAQTYQEGFLDGWNEAWAVDEPYHVGFLHGWDEAWDYGYMAGWYDAMHPNH